MREKFENFLSFVITHRILKKKVKKESMVSPQLNNVDWNWNQ